MFGITGGIEYISQGNKSCSESLSKSCSPGSQLIGSQTILDFQTFLNSEFVRKSTSVLNLRTSLKK